MPAGRHLGEQTTQEAARLASSTLLVPLGATEQHGPHLPLSTDTTIAVAWCERIAARHAECVIAPALPYGSSGEHQSFAGTLSIGHDALRLVLFELVRSAALSFELIVFVSGHAGNLGVLNEVTEQMRGEGHRVSALVPVLPGSDAHAGDAETSIMLHLEPDSVRTSLIEPGCTQPLSSILDTMVRGGVAAVAPNGVLGDPTTASAEKGESLLTQLGEEAIDFGFDFDEG